MQREKEYKIIRTCQSRIELRPDLVLQGLRPKETH